MGNKLEPFFQTGSVTVYHGNCLEIAPILSDVDLLLSDPPYGIDYVKGETGNRGMYSEATKLCRNERKVEGDDQDFDPSPWLKYPNVMLWGASHFATRLPSLGSWHVWDKTDGGKGPDDSFSDVEIAWASIDRNDSIHHHLWKGICQKGAGQKRLHPMQKPVEVMGWCLDFFPDCDTVLDPYAGSGSTLVAAQKKGMQAIGIEIEKSDCETIRDRLAQGSLF